MGSRCTIHAPWNWEWQGKAGVGVSDLSLGDRIREIVGGSMPFE